MALMVDARIVIVFGAASEAQQDDAVLTDNLAAGSHPAGCLCCTPRSAAAESLGRLFVQRARGEVAFFRRVLVVMDTAGEAAVRTALQSDPVVSARFRLA